MAKNKDKQLEVSSFAFEYRLITRYNHGIEDNWKPCSEIQKQKLSRMSQKYEFRATKAPNPTENMVIDEE